MKRLYLSKLTLANGEAISAVERILDSGVMGDNVSAAYATYITPEGTLGNDYSLCLVDAPNHTPLLDDPDNWPLPDFPFDAQIAMMYGPTKDALRAGLVARGFALQDLDDNSDSYRMLIRGIGRTLDPAFNENNFDPA